MATGYRLEPYLGWLQNHCHECCLYRVSLPYPIRYHATVRFPSERQLACARALALVSVKTPPRPNRQQQRRSPRKSPIHSKLHRLPIYGIVCTNLCRLIESNRNQHSPQHAYYYSINSRNNQPELSTTPRRASVVRIRLVSAPSRDKGAEGDFAIFEWGTLFAHCGAGPATQLSTI